MEVAISKMFYQSMYQNVAEWKLMFFDKTLSKSEDFYCLEPGVYPSITEFVGAMNTLIREKQNTAKIVSQLKCREEPKKLRFTLQMKNLVLHSSVQIWDAFSELMLAMNLE